MHKGGGEGKGGNVAMTVCLVLLPLWRIPLESSLPALWLRLSPPLLLLGLLSVPPARLLGYKGSLPHFSRTGQDTPLQPTSVGVSLLS